MQSSRTLQGQRLLGQMVPTCASSQGDQGDGRGVGRHSTGRSGGHWGLVGLEEKPGSATHPLVTPNQLPACPHL